MCRFRPALEALEDRSVPSTLSINNASAIEGSNTLKHLDRFIPQGSGGLAVASGSIFGPDGNLYVCSEGSNSVLRYDGATGAFKDIFVTSGSGGLQQPRAPTFGPDGNLYVSSIVTGQVLCYSGSSGAFLGAVASGLSKPFGLTFGSDGSLYIAEQNTDEVLRYNNSGLSTFVTAGSGGLSQPRKVVFGPDGNMYVASQGTGQVLRYDGATGAFMDVFATMPPSEAGTGTMWLEFGTDGYLYTTARDSPASLNVSIVRFNAANGTYVDRLQLGRDGWSFDLGPRNIVYESPDSAGGFVDRFGPSSLAAFTVSLNSASSSPVTVSYSTADGTALAGKDYTAVSGTLTFAPGQTTRTIIVPTLVDSIGGPTPIFTLNLANAVGASIAKGQGVGTIEDNNVTLVNIAVTPTSIPSGGTATVTLTAKDAAGNPLTGLPFTFGWSATGFLNTGSGSFGSVTDNHDGTYTASFTGTTVGLTSSITITASLFDQGIASNMPVITVTPSVPAAQLAVTSVNPTSVTAGGAVAFTITAEDGTGAAVPSYGGTLHFTSSDPSAVLPSDYTFTSADRGTHSFTGTLQSAGNQTITVTDQANNSLTATTNPISVSGGAAKLVVKIPSGNTIVAGNPFLITVQAVDTSGNPLTSYTESTAITVSSSPPDPQNSFTGTLNSSGFGFFFGNLKTAGSYTLTATAGTVSGTSSSLTVIPSDASYFTVATPATASTGGPFNVTVTAFDHYGNVATGYTGTVKLSSSDAAAATLVNSYTFTTGPGKDNGVRTFSTTLATGGSQTITATDTTASNPAIVGASGPITTRGLVVSNFSPTPTGFTAIFSKRFVPDNISLWGGTVAKPIQDVTLVGDKSGPVSGSLIIDPTNTSITFKASAIYLSTFFQSSVLPNDTWHVRLVSGSSSHGFVDALGAGQDGANNGGHADYTTTFTTANDGKLALNIPDFARGPDGGHTVKVPNDSAAGIPVTLSNAAAVTDVVFALSYNPELFTPTGGGTANAPAGSAFTMGSVTSIDATHATAIFTFHNNTAQSGTVVLGDILASVPDAAANQYKAKELLDVGSTMVNGAPFTGVSADGLHVNAYLGDVTGNGTITALDVATASTVAQGSPTSPLGLAAYRLVDPALIGDIAGDASIDATAVSDLASFTANLHPPQIPALPTGLTITPSGPDPTLSLGALQKQEEGEKGRQGEGERALISPLLPLSASPGLSVTVPVLLDNPRPEGSTGMTEAILALTYDPKVLTVSSADITLGSIPDSGWRLVSEVDQLTGRIGIDLYSTMGVSAAQAGSLVNIVFHVLPGAYPTTTTVELVNAVTVNGEHFATQVDDAQGQLVLSAGVDEVVITAAQPFLMHGRRPARVAR
jgi:hypothetical protein